MSKRRGCGGEEKEEQWVEREAEKEEEEEGMRKSIE